MRGRGLLAALIVVIGCTPTPTPLLTPGAVVVARVPRGVELLPDAQARFPSGATVVRTTLDGAELLLSDGLDAAGAPAVHYDGTSILFVGRRTPDESFVVFECAADGSGRRVVVDHGRDCIRADFLPDGRIVYAAELAGPSPLPEVAHGTALFVADGDGGPGVRITFGAGLDCDPAVLDDGRVVFSSWRPAAGRLGLFTVHPDGTGYAAFHLPDGHAVLPRQAATRDVDFVLLTEDALRTMSADWDAPMSVASDAPAPDAIELRGRPRAQGHLSSVRPGGAYGTLICVDARRTGSKAATRARFVFADTGQGLGVVPLESDGSFAVRVPADTPLRIELLDAAGAVRASEMASLWVRPGEVRVCVSCHDDVETAPPNVRPAAVLGEPMDLTRGGQ